MVLPPAPFGERPAGWSTAAAEYSWRSTAAAGGSTHHQQHGELGRRGRCSSATGYSRRGPGATFTSSLPAGILRCAGCVLLRRRPPQVGVKPATWARRGAPGRGPVPWYAAELNMGRSESRQHANVPRYVSGSEATGLHPTRGRGGGRDVDILLGSYAGEGCTCATHVCSAESHG